MIRLLTLACPLAISPQRVQWGKCLTAALGLLLTPLASPVFAEDRSLVVGAGSRVAVMEYEAWFGPNGANFPANGIRPLLKSADMAAVGGGYDSADPAVIRQHVVWMEQMGVDAALIEITNNVSCVFNSAWFVQKYLKSSGSCPTLRSDYQVMRDNTGNLYPAWTNLGTRLKLIPLVGGIDRDVLFKDIDGKTAFEKVIDYFGERMQRYPARNVVYEGKPLMLIYLGAAQDPATAHHPLWYQIRQFLKEHPAIAGKYTFRMMAGYLDSQPALWAKQGRPAGPVRIAPQYHFWSWVDRLKPSCSNPLCPYYPTYNEAGRRVENLTAAIAVAGAKGWGCPHPNSPPYCNDDSIRFGKGKTYATFEAYMAYARRLDPIFLFVHQFNEFVQPDEGFDANTDDDIEPANLWGNSAIEVVQRELKAYHHPMAGR